MTAEFGHLIRKYMAEAGIKTQGQLAEIGEFNPSVISRYLKGIQNAPPAETEDLIRALRIPLPDQASFMLHAAGHHPNRVEDVINVLQKKEEYVLSDAETKIQIIVTR